MGTQLEAAAHKLLDFSQPTNTTLLDQTVNTFYGAPSAEEVSKLLQGSPWCVWWACRLPGWLIVSQVLIWKADRVPGSSIAFASRTFDAVGSKSCRT